jgi:hypothetical protein
LKRERIEEENFGSEAAAEHEPEENIDFLVHAEVLVADHLHH